MFLLSLIAVVLIIILCMGFSSTSLMFLFDIPSFIILLLTLVAALLQTGLWKDFNNSFRLTIGRKAKASFKEIKRAIAALQLARKTVISTAIFTLGVSIIVILTQLSTPETLGLNLAVATLVVVYAAFFNLIFLPMEKQLEVQLIEFDGEEFAEQFEIQKRIGSEMEKGPELEVEEKQIETEEQRKQQKEGQW